MSRRGAKSQVDQSLTTPTFLACPVAMAFAATPSGVVEKQRDVTAGWQRVSPTFFPLMEYNFRKEASLELTWERMSPQAELARIFQVWPLRQSFILAFLVENHQFPA